VDLAEPAFATTNDGTNDGAFWFTSDQFSGAASATIFIVREVRPNDVTPKFPAGPGFGYSIQKQNMPVVGQFGAAVTPNFGNPKNNSDAMGMIKGYVWNDLNLDGKWQAKRDWTGGVADLPGRERE